MTNINQPPKPETNFNNAHLVGIHEAAEQLLSSDNERVWNLTQNEGTLTRRIVADGEEYEGSPCLEFKARDGAVGWRVFAGFLPEGLEEPFVTIVNPNGDQLVCTFFNTSQPEISEAPNNVDWFEGNLPTIADVLTEVTLF